MDNSRRFADNVEITGVFLDFCLLIFTLPVVVCRLWALSPKAKDASTPDIATAVLAEAEMCLALILASATCLKPFLQPFHPGWFAANNTTATGLTGNHSANTTKQSNPYYELSGVNGGGTSSRKDKVQKAIASVTSARDTRGDNASDELDLI
ncbi:hypothetical protein LTR85_005689 [Meristemomyces frigidus]|nr:hypothetical protein LTR85_005689 [Meristemomyces frigidus]